MLKIFSKLGLHMLISVMLIKKLFSPKAIFTNISKDDVTTQLLSFGRFP